MAEKKMTKREMFEKIKAVEGLTADMVAFIDHELELLAKKNSADKKPTATQKENVAIKSAILEEMADNRLYTISEMQKEISVCAELSNQRVSAIVRQMVVDGHITRTEDKRKAYFSKVSE